MSILSLVALASLGTAVVNGLKITSGKVADLTLTRHKLGNVKSLGLLALVIGCLGQLIGLYSAFEYIATNGNVSPELLAGGIRVSSITSIYGMLIFVISYLVWFGLDYLLNKSEK